MWLLILELLGSLWLSVLSFLVSHIKSYSPHLLPYKPEAEVVVYYQLSFNFRLIRQQVRGVTFNVGYQKGEYRKPKATK